MIIFTNNIQYSESLLGVSEEWIPYDKKIESEAVCLLNVAIFPRESIYKTELVNIPFWNYLFISDFSTKSQYDILIETVEQTEVPDKILCFSKEGNNFHGQKNRDWVSLPGNIHLSVFFSPNTHINQFHNGAMVLGAISALQTIDSIDSIQKQAQIKWVNDIQIEGKKVCGIIAHSKTRDKCVTMITLGIGLNVEVTPDITPGEFFQETTCLLDFSIDLKICTLSIVFEKLIYFIEQNYQKLFDNQYKNLIKSYRYRSFVIGKNVQIISETTHKIIAEGKVLEINDDLSLLIENSSKPIRNGRLVIIE